MKTASKVFIMIDLVWKGLCICFLVFTMAACITAMIAMEASTIFLFLIPIFVPGMVSDIIALKKLNHADCKADIPTGLSVCVLIFSNLLAGIFMLSLSDKDFISTTVNQTVSYQDIPPTQPMDDYYRGRSNGNPNAYRNPYPNEKQNTPANPASNPNHNPSAGATDTNGNHNIHPDQQ